MHSGIDNIRYGVITVSDSRYNKLISGISVDDPSGNYLKEELNAKVYAIIPDNRDMVIGLIDHIIDYHDIDAIVITGGTGVSKRDSTPETLEEIFTKTLDGFKYLFHKLSYEDIGYSTILSRSTCGIYRNKVIYSLPGSLGACKTGIKIIKSQTGHIVRHLNE